MFDEKDTNKALKGIKQTISEKISQYDEKKISLEDITVATNNACMAMRIAIENIVEQDLLAGTIKRYQVALHTQNLKKVTRIKEEDCKLIDRMMTEYSKSVHSSPEDAHANKKTIGSIQEDIEVLIKWIRQFKERT